MGGFVKKYLFTSESVAEGHPDKMADLISDSFLDAVLEKDKNARVACDVYTTTGLILVGGQITTNSFLDSHEIVRQTVKEIGYTDSSMGFDADTCSVLVAFDKQSPDIAMGVDESDEHEQGAGDQGLVFGYACKETPEFMPMPIMFAHKLISRLTLVRKEKILNFLRPDGKSQVTIEYIDNRPARVDTVVIAAQHSADVSNNKIRDSIIEEVIKKVIPAGMMDKNTKIFVNSTGKFVVGGPKSDCGMTGRKIIVDTYGGSASHGGGAFSGKDPSKVDRSAAYMARYVAKNLVAAGVAEKLKLQVAYAIGIAKPVSMMVDTEGTSNLSSEKIIEIINKFFDFRPKKIIEALDLLRPIYKKTACGGHFGRNEPGFSWEKLDKVESIKSFLK
jgi:S-adenosylmethionine synthetase